MTRHITLLLLFGLLITSIILVGMVGITSYRQGIHTFNELGKQNALLGSQMVQYIIKQSHRQRHLYCR